MFSKQETSAASLVRLTVIPVVLGLAAGMAGALFAESYLIATSSPPSEVALLQIGQPTPSVSTALAEGDLAGRLHAMDIPMYPRKAAAGSDLADQARAPYEAVGYATVITSDGWLATAQSVLTAGAVLAGVGGRLLEPTVQVTDPRTGIVFFKIDATALPVSGFEDTQQLHGGTQLYAEGSAGLFMQARFGGRILADHKIAAGLLHDSDKFSLSYRLDRALDAHAVGGAVMTTGGTLAGIIVPGTAGADTFVPMHLIQPILSEVFHGHAPARALLGAHYLTPQEAVFSDPNLGPLAGVRLSSSRLAGVPAVRIGSAAQRAGLQDGDLILRIDDTDLNSGSDLAELVSGYAPGSKVRFEIIRKGARQSVDVTFD
jgi:serine protease Do